MPKIAMVLTPDFSDWEYALLAGTGGPFFGHEVQFFAPKAGEVRSMGGLVALVPQSLAEVPAWRPDALVMVGGQIWETNEAPEVNGLIKEQYDRGGVVAGICGGTLALARASLLNNIRHTSNDAAFLADNAKGYSGSEYYVESASAISHNRVITAPGTAPVSFTAAVFESVGMDAETVGQFKTMLAAEHG
jgi:putative intracellular protease/amidase